MPEQTFPVNGDDVLKVDASGYSVPVVFGVAANAAVTKVTAVGSGNNVGLLAANPARKGAVFFNYSSEELYLKMGSPGSLTDYSVIIGSQAYYQLPNFTGDVWGQWPTTSPDGGVQVTELS